MSDNKNMKIFSIDNIAEEISKELVVNKMYDLYRFVDISSYEVHDFINGKMVNTGEKCYSLWNRSQPCYNCSSLRAYSSNKQHFKMEYLQDQSFLISSNPWKHKEKKLVLELGKNITDIFSVYDPETNKSTKLREVLNRYSDMAMRDAFTGLYCKAQANKIMEKLFNEDAVKMTLAIFDINNFKSVNDTFGHTCGDEVILDRKSVV